MPAFESGDGKCLQESNAIAYYVANEQLRGGKSDYEQSQVLQWIGFAEAEILPAACAWVFPLLGIIKTDSGSEEVCSYLLYYVDLCFESSGGGSLTKARIFLLIVDILVKMRGKIYYIGDNIIITIVAAIIIIVEATVPVITVTKIFL